MSHNRLKVPDDEALIREMLRLPQNKSAPTTKVNFAVKSWLHRLGNSRTPDRAETVISLYGEKVDKGLHAYLTFHPSDTGSVPPPNYDAKNQRVFVNYSTQQLASVYRILDMMDRTVIGIIYLEYDTGHKWAELQHNPIS